MTRSIYCCGCSAEVSARLTSGKEIYPHRPDLYGIPFWKCDACGNYVGCHHKSRIPTQPLGSIPTKEIREARNGIHKVLDPMWRFGKWDRRHLYKELSSRLGKEYHTADIRTLEEASRIQDILKELNK